MPECWSCGTCVPWLCPKCGEWVCNWFDTENNQHRDCGGVKPERVRPARVFPGGDSKDD